MSGSDQSSTRPKEGIYEAKARFTMAEAPGLRVRQLMLSAGQCVPWHYHNEITDTFFCMKGPMCVQTREPEAAHVLQAGETVAIPPGQPHYAAGVDDGACQFMLVQGVGTYDYVSIDD